ncbi:uncharacterized protein [Polyergus mexicanus]|uniref:uncharacterized protein isoform X3 n=1 Tax=Polyergus mexicanus TaxID=615972 RepID=UPI0038B48507
MSKQRLWNTEWKRLKRKSDQNLNILAQEEYFEHIAEKSAYYDFNKKCCNREQQYVHEDHDTDIIFYNDLISNNEYYHDHESNYDQSITQKDIKESQSCHMESIDALQICFALTDKKRSIYEVDDASIITTINNKELPSSFGCHESQNQNNITVPISNTLYKQKEI